MTQNIEQPLLMTLAEIPERIHEVIAWTIAHPVDDYVMYFPLPRCGVNDGKSTGEWGLRHLLPLRSVDAYVAGSAALHRLLETMESCSPVKWQPGDVDLFFLNQAVNSRVSFNSFDVVQCKEATVEELLLNFDLPVCRVGMNFAFDFWISAQCLAAIHTRKQNVPKYLKNKLSFNATLATNMKFKDSVIRLKHEYLYSRFVDRVKKYQNRGYGVNWIDTDVIIPWVRNRFHYGEWLMPQ